MVSYPSSFLGFYQGLVLEGHANLTQLSLPISGTGLGSLTVESFEKYFQIAPENPIIGADARVNLLKNVGASLLNNSDIFGTDGRPGKLVGK